MGRIKTTLVKRTAEDILKKNPDIFDSDFDKTKKNQEKVADIPSKKLRNGIAGYIVRLVRRKNKTS